MHATSRVTRVRRSRFINREQRFPELLEALSARFIRIPYDRIDSEIGGWLEQVCLSLDLDRVVVAEYLPEQEGFYTTYQWNREGFPAAPGPNVAASKFLPWVSAKGTGGEIVLVPNIDALPPEATGDKDFMSGAGPKAIAGVPAIIGNRLIAGFAFEDFHGERHWAPSLVKRLKLVSDIFGNALERKRTAMEAAGLRDEMQGAAHLALVGEVAAAMAHELSHPLAAILANAQAARRLLENTRPNLTELREVLDDVITGERRAAAYVAKVRTVFRRSELHKESLPIHVILEEVVSLTRNDLRIRGISLEMHIEPGLPLICADRVGLEQVMINLIQNAADATADNDRSARLITIRALRTDPQHVRISVSDNGKGIDQNDLVRIFQPLFTTKSRGTGMGLAIVRSIIESHGSRIKVESKLRAGATFEFALPVADIDETYRREG